MKVEDLAYKLYSYDVAHKDGFDIYSRDYFYKNIKSNELCLSYYNRALKKIRKEKLVNTNNISKNDN